MVTITIGDGTTIKVCTISNVTYELVVNLIDRDAKGRAKYGTSLDRTDLTQEQWLDHMTEELLDAAGYAQSVKRRKQQDEACKVSL